MSAVPGPLNPIFYAQFNVRGGWRNTLAVMGGYAALIGCGIWLTTSDDNPSRRAESLNNWLVGLLGLQVLILMMYGSFRVSAAIRSDISSRRIESHRLMPVSSFSALVGYILGGPFQAIALAFANFVIGLLVCAMAGASPERWLTATGMLLAFVIFNWILTAQFTLTARGGFALLLLATAVAFMSSGAATMIFPAISVITAPMLGRTVFRLSTSFDTNAFAYTTALVAQGVIGTLSLGAGMRKYRWPNSAGFTPLLGILLLSAWVVISIIGMQYRDEFIFYNYYRYERQTASPQLVASIISAMLLAVVPIGSAARSWAEWRRNGGLTPAQQRKPVPMFFVVLPAIAICSSLLISIQYHADSHELLVRRLQSILVIFTQLAALAFLLRWSHQWLSRPWVILVVWLIFIWLGPMIIDSIYHGMINSREPLGALSTSSPIGALVAIWTRNELLSSTILIYHCVIAALPALLLLSTRRPLPAMIAGESTI